MGAIQNSINKMSASVAGAAVGLKHAQEKEALAEEQGLLAKEQYHEASADLSKLEGESSDAEKALKTATEEADALMKSGADKETLAKKLTEKEAADRAFRELADRIEARKAMMSRAEKIMKRTGTWGGIK